MNRDPNGYDCTCDPVYLGQSRRLQLIEYPHWCESIDCESVAVTDLDEAPDEIVAALDHESSIGLDRFIRIMAEIGAENDAGAPLVFETWNTERVFLTRSEGEAWMKSRSYRWGYGWRVYCVCAEGELARLLNELPEPAKEHAWHGCSQDIAQPPQRNLDFDAEGNSLR